MIKSLADADSLVFTFIMPIGLANIGWKMYMANASWDILTLVLIVSIPHYQHHQLRSLRRS